MTDAPPLWRDSAAEAFSAPVFEGERTADMLIVGGGFTGLSAALEAAGQGADVLLLEAMTVGHGGSGRNVGLVNAGLWLPPDDVCARLGAEAGARLNTALAEGPQLVFDLIRRHTIACEPRRVGTLHLAHRPAALTDLRARHAQMLARGAPVTLLGPQDTCMRTGTARFAGALHDARAGTLQPLAYARGLARAATGQGARVFEHSPVTGAAHRGGRWIVTTPRGKVRAQRLIMATNAYHMPVAHTPVPQVPVVQFFQLATEPLGHNLAGSILPGGEGCWDTGLIMCSLRRDAAGRVILGGMGGGAGAHHDWARRKLARLFPHLSGVGIDHAWAGRIAMTHDHLPRLLRLGDAALALFGYSGRGIAPGTVMGRAVAHALLSGDESGLPLAPVAAHREWLTGPKTAFFEAAARLVHLGSARF